MLILSRLAIAQRENLVGTIDEKQLLKVYRRYLQEVSGDLDLLQGLAIAETQLGTGHPGFIPVVQKLGCQIADLK